MTTSNDIYISCYTDNFSSDYCKIVEQIGEIPQQDTYLYDIGFLMFFIIFFIVIISPFIFLFKLIKGVKE